VSSSALVRVHFIRVQLLRAVRTALHWQDYLRTEARAS